MAEEKTPRAVKATTTKTGTTQTGTTKKTAATAKTKAAKTKAETAKPKAATLKAVRAHRPKPAAVAPVTPEMVAERAYYLWADGSGGDAFARWVQAERELTAA